MKSIQACALALLVACGVVSNPALAASVTVTISGLIDHPSNLLNGGERLQYFGVQQNDPFAISFRYDDQQTPGFQEQPVQGYVATLGTASYAFTNPSQNPVNGPQHSLMNNDYAGKSGVEDIGGFTDAQANFGLRFLNASTASQVRNFKATDAPITLTDALFDPSYISTLFFGASGSASNADPSSISGFISSISLAATPTLSAVPIPAAFWLFLTGLVALFGVARKAKLAG